MIERSISPGTASTGSGLRWVVGLLAAFALLLGAASCSSDDDSGDSGSSMELTPSSDDIDGSDDSEGETSGASDPDAGDSEDGGSGESGAGPMEPVELSTDEEAYRDDLLAAIEVDDDDAGFDMECLTGRWIQVAGLERLDSEGVTPEVFAEEGPTAIDLGRDDALEFARAYERCGMDLHDFLLPQDLDPTLRTCITDALDRSDVEDYVVLAIQGNDEEAQAMQVEISAATSHCTE